MKGMTLGLVVSMLFAGTAWAEPPHQPPPGAPADGWGNRGQESREHLREEVMGQMQAIRMWKITEELKLDEATAAKVFPLLARYDEQEKALGKDRADIVRDLKQALEAPKPDQARVSGMVDRLLAVRARKTALEQEKIIALRKVLTPLQQGKLLLLLPRIEGGFRERMREAMGRDGQAEVPGGGRQGPRRDFERY